MASAVNSDNSGFEENMDFEPTLGDDGVDAFSEEMDDTPNPFDDEGSGNQESINPSASAETSQKLNSREQVINEKGLGLDFDLSEIEGIEGVIVGDMGIKVGRMPVDKAKFTKDVRAVISIVSSRAAIIKMHYQEGGLGPFICREGKCCDALGIPRVRYIFPIVQYDTDSSGRKFRSTKLRYKALSLGQDAYDDLLMLMDTNESLKGDITGIDIMVSCSDEKYQKLTFHAFGESRWRKNQVLAKEVNTFWKKNIKNLIRPVARSVTELELMQNLMAGDIDPAAEVSFDEVFN